MYFFMYKYDMSFYCGDYLSSDVSQCQFYNDLIDGLENLNKYCHAHKDITFDDFYLLTKTSIC